MQRLTQEIILWRKKISELLRKPLFVYLFGLYFLIYKTSQYFPAFELFTFTLFFLIYCLITNFFIKVLEKIKMATFADILVFLFWIVFCMPNELLDIANKSYAIPQGYRYHAAFLYILAILIIIFFFRRKFSPRLMLAANLLFNTLILVNICTTLFFGYQVHVNENKHALLLDQRQRNSQLPILDNNRDIIWILLDEYASTPQMKQIGYANPFGDSLRNAGFFVFDSLASRAGYTPFSIESIFNLDDSLPNTNALYAQHYLSNNALAAQLKVKGYAFYAYDFLDLHSSKEHIQISDFFPYAYGLRLLDGTILYSLYSRYYSLKIRSIDNYNQTALNSLNSHLGLRNDSAQFIWAHLLMPHAPFFRDSIGNLLYPKNTTTLNKEEISTNYISYLKYTNKIILEQIHRIPDWQNKIIIISGDHGFRFYPTGNKRHFETTFAAIYYSKLDTFQLKKTNYIQQILLNIEKKK